MEVETARQNGYAGSSDGSRESSVERELNGDIKAVELNGSSGSPRSQNGLMKKPHSVADGHDGRIKRKAKRLIQRQNSRDYIVPHRRWKNSRRSRTAYGRGLPKKGGAGGKGVWGLPGSEALEELYEDENDPNYDNEILTGFLRPYVTSVIVEIALDHKDSQREMTSVLISDLYGRVITGRDIEKGNFLARAVADDCIPPKIITKPSDHGELNEHAMTAIRRADTLLHMKQGWAHLDNVWGMGGSIASRQNYN
ncbi:Programmed cell death protein 4 [Lucilia cuprina]|nr:Programmed cell death protein 4 [Lucilia cuprina]